MGATPAKHHRLLLAELERLWNTPGGRLMVTMPPGSAKSTYSSVLFPAWCLAQKEGTAIIGASHSANLAEEFSRRVQGYIRDNVKVLGYQMDRENAELWSTTNRGAYRAAGVGGAIAGFRADLCMVSGTQVQTPAGPVAIDDVNPGDEVLSYDPGTKRVVWRPVVAKATKAVSEYYRVRTAAGRVVAATGEHRFYTRRGWVRADQLTPGDVLLRSVWDDRSTPGLRDEEGAQAERYAPVLQQDVRGAQIERREGPAQPVPALRKANVFAAGLRKLTDYLLR